MYVHMFLHIDVNPFHVCRCYIIDQKEPEMLHVIDDVRGKTLRSSIVERRKKKAEQNETKRYNTGSPQRSHGFTTEKE